MNEKTDRETLESLYSTKEVCLIICIGAFTLFLVSLGIDIRQYIQNNFGTTKLMLTIVCSSVLLFVSCSNFVSYKNIKKRIKKELDKIYKS